FGRLQRDAHRREQLVAMVIDGIEGARANQRLDDAPVRHALVDAAAKVEQVAKRTTGCARLENRRQRRLAGALEGAQPVAYGARVHRLETDAAGVDVGRLKRQAVGDAVEEKK